METERLVIDAVRETDKEDYFFNISHDKKVLETFICRYAETPEEFDFSSYPGREDLFAVRLKETGRLIGIVTYFDEKDGACEIGYGIGSGFWRRGYATEAVRRFLEYLFREKGMETVCASFFTGNDASRRVMEKCGMRFSRFSEKELTYLDVERDLTYYEIRRDEWEALQGAVRKTIRVAAAVITDGGRVFATQRGYGAWKDYWEFPGGKIEPGETPEEALRREIREELAAEISVDGLIDTVTYDYPEFRLVMDCFRCTLTGGEPTLLEAEAARWLGREELLSVRWLPADLQLIEARLLKE